MDRSFTALDPPEVFISYASKDERLFEEFKPHLEGLELQNVIKVWHGRKILPGEDWHQVISDHLKTAQIVLLLVSKNFLASEYCFGVEFRLAEERHELGAAQVIPIILYNCNWRSTPVGRFEALPDNGNPVSKWGDIEDAFVDVVNGITKVVEKLKGDGGRRWPKIARETPIVVRNTVPAGRYALVVVAVLIAVILIVIIKGYYPWARSHEAPPGEVRIQVNEVPPYDPIGGPNSPAHIAGNVSGASSPEFSLVIYSFTSAWYVQPTEDKSETRINPDGSWSAVINGGSRYAVLLVHRNYHPPSPIPTNPTRLDDVVTSVEFEGKR